MLVSQHSRAVLPAAVDYPCGNGGGDAACVLCSLPWGDQTCAALRCQWLSHRSSVIGHQPSGISHQPSVISHTYQPSVISHTHQPSAISHQSHPSAISHQSSVTPITHHPSAISHQSHLSAISHQESGITHCQWLRSPATRTCSTPRSVSSHATTSPSLALWGSVWTAALSAVICVGVGQGGSGWVG